jgi:Uma2 family endonuclease
MTPTAAFDPGRTKLIYGWAADRYLRSLPLEHFMEATNHARQREITLESFALVRAARPDVQVFNELLVQYPRVGEDPDKPGQVVPDNFVVIHSEPIDADTSFILPLQPVGPFLVLDYVSKNSRRKDYEDNHQKYEHELKVPYYLLFYPDNEELSVFRMVGGKFTTLLPNESGRLAIPELEIEAGLLDGWVRYWFRGELLPLPGELLRQLNAARVELSTAQNELSTTRVELTSTRVELTSTRDQLTAEQAARVAVEAELARLREELAKAKGESA